MTYAYTTPIYSNASNTNIACTITHPTLGKIPFNATANDVDPDGAALYATIIANAAEIPIGVYIAPAPAAPPTKITPLQFMSRFTSDEEMAIATAAMTNVTVWLWFQKMTAASYIDLTDPSVATGLAALVTAGLLTSDRVLAILAP